MQSWLPLITGSGGALIVLALWVGAFITGKIHSDPDYTKLEAENEGLRAANDKLTEALALERQRSNDAVQAGAVTNQLIGGLVKLATERAAIDQGGGPPARREATPLDLTAKDLGL